MKQITEYWVRATDEYDDVLSVEFYDSKKQATSDGKRFAASVEGCEKYYIDKVVRKYQDDGELVSEDDTEIDCVEL